MLGTFGRSDVTATYLFGALESGSSSLGSSTRWSQCDAFLDTLLSQYPKMLTQDFIKAYASDKP